MEIKKPKTEAELIMKEIFVEVAEVALANIQHDRIRLGKLSDKTVEVVKLAQSLYETIGYNHGFLLMKKDLKEKEEMRLEEIFSHLFQNK